LVSGATPPLYSRQGRLADPLYKRYAVANCSVPLIAHSFILTRFNPHELVLGTLSTFLHSTSMLSLTHHARFGGRSPYSVTKYHLLPQLVINVHCAYRGYRPKYAD